MSLRENDLKDTIIKKISVDEFEPKTGENKDVVVVGYKTISKSAGDDLYSFLNSSIYEWRDIEVSPNSDDDGHYIVFVELNRNKDVLETIINMTTDVSNIAGDLNWQAKTNLMDDYVPLDSEQFATTLVTDPDNYKTREEMDKEKSTEEQEQKNNAVMEFLSKSILDSVSIEEDVITMGKGRDSAKLRISGFGNKEIMQDIGISESALKPLDVQMNMFNSMLGEMRAVGIEDYIVIFHPDQQQVLVTQSCSDS